MTVHCSESSVPSGLARDLLSWTILAVVDRGFLDAQLCAKRVLSFIPMIFILKHVKLMRSKINLRDTPRDGSVRAFLGNSGQKVRLSHTPNPQHSELLPPARLYLLKLLEASTLEPLARGESISHSNHTAVPQHASKPYAGPGPEKGC